MPTDLAAGETTPVASTAYEPARIEEKWYRFWESGGYFAAHASGEKKPHVIMMPPPNVTGRLHMGHALQDTVQDSLTRIRRMQGREALWMPGIDHAGIATQNVVERTLAGEGTNRHELGREAFVDRVWDWVDEYGDIILQQKRRLGDSCDWSRQRFTFDEAYVRAVQQVFVQLYEEGLIYRGKYLVNWDPANQTALSDEEAEPVETEGSLYFLRYPVAGDFDGELPRLADGRAYVVVATTRPETMLGDVAVAVHPEDERYRGLIGAELELPLTGRRIPVLADDFVDPEFGTGAVKITPGHDPNDFEMGLRHNLPVIDVMTPEAHLNDQVPDPFRGLERFEARTAVVDALGSVGLLERTRPHTHAVPHCYRCSTVVEPRVSEQWFVRMKPLAEPALQAARDGRVTFTPDRWTRVYEHWMENIRDWCISRQLWWGHRIPVWYCRNSSCGETIVAREDPTGCPRCGGTALVQDPDVLDTWFSSWLWPFSTLGWPEETADLRTFYPTQTLVTAPEILFFWVSRMVMAGIEFRGEVPFHDVLLHGTVRDHLGRKMSKSLGNGIDPLEVVERYGADALRYTLISGMGVGADVLLNYEDLDATFAPGRNFANKLWNAGRFALMNLGDEPVAAVEEVEDDLELADRWILSRAERAAADVTDRLERFRLNEAALTGYNFFWGEVADWYLELVKPRLRGDQGDASRAAARATLVRVLDVTMRLLHPVTPFITETVWQRLPRRMGNAPSIMIAEWPEVDPARTDPDAEARMETLREVITAVRNIRAEYGVAPATRVQLHYRAEGEGLGELLALCGQALDDLARVDAVARKGEEAGAGASAVLRSGAELFVPLEGVIDLDRERARLRAELERTEGIAAGARKRLENESFVARAPAEVVEREREKLASVEDQRDRLAATLRALGGDG